MVASAQSLAPSHTTPNFTAGRLSFNNLPNKTVTAATTLDNSYQGVLANATSAAFTITLPAAATYTGKAYTVTKSDSSANVVTIAAAGSDNIESTTLKQLVNQWDQVEILSDGTEWVVCGTDPEAYKLLARVPVDLTTVATTTVYTVPTGKTLKVARLAIEGKTAQSGGTSSKLLVGTSGNSYNELLNGSTGHTFISGTATSLLAVGAAFNAADLYPPATASVAQVVSFAAGSVIGANVSGTVVTAGAVYVELWGRLV